MLGRFKNNPLLDCHLLKHFKKLESEKVDSYLVEFNRFSGI